MSETSPHLKVEADDSAAAITPAAVSMLKLQRQVGNQQVTRLVAAGGRTDQARRGAWPPVLQRRALGSVVDEDDDTIHIHTRTVEQWKRFLAGADAWAAAIELNAFMAKAVGHSVYERGGQSDRASQAEHLSRLQTPTADEQRDLAIAMLTSGQTDLRQVGDASPVTGLLLPRFLRATYQAAAHYIAEQAGGQGQAAQWQINPDVIDHFLGEAGGTHSDLASLAPRTDYVGGMPVRVPGALHTVGTSSVGSSPADELQAGALAGAQASAAAAFGDVTRDPSNVGTIRDRYARQVRTHSQVLRGIIERQNRLAALQAAILDGVIGVIFAGAGPLLSKLRVFGEVVGDSTSRSVAMAIAQDRVKAATDATAKALGGKTGDDLKRSARSAFSTGLQEHINGIRKGKGTVPNEVMDVKASLEAQFHFGTD